MIARSGLVTRPAGASMRGPRSGARVTWELTQPIIDLCEQGERHGFPNLGTVGNTEHLRRHGDHTPWAVGKIPGYIYAKDTDDPPGFKRWLINRCKDPGYDTSWIDYFNIDGTQYDNAGKRVAASDDVHFHISVRKGFEKTHVTLFDDFVRDLTGDDMPTMDELLAKLVPAVAKAVWTQGVSSKTFENGTVHGAHEGVLNAIDANDRLRRLEAAVKDLAGRVDTLAKP